eukprot:6213951-Pleurochrysis_carterae.AAC.2
MVERSRATGAVKVAPWKKSEDCRSMVERSRATGAVKVAPWQKSEDCRSMVERSRETKRSAQPKITMRVAVAGNRWRGEGERMRAQTGGCDAAHGRVRTCGRGVECVRVCAHDCASVLYTVLRDDAARQRALANVRQRCSDACMRARTTQSLSCRLLSKHGVFYGCVRDRRDREPLRAIRGRADLERRRAAPTTAREWTGGPNERVKRQATSGRAGAKELLNGRTAQGAKHRIQGHGRKLLSFESKRL